MFYLAVRASRGCNKAFIALQRARRWKPKEALLQPWETLTAGFSVIQHNKITSQSRYFDFGTLYFENFQVLNSVILS